jgi:RNA polymerase sigma factor (sigma-70 family)
MSDSEVVASIVAGDPAGLAAAYDKYAADLYGYCLSLLQEPHDAADAVQDTFVIAASKLAGLRDPERLRAWLFAVARNECLHRLKTRHAAAPLQDVPEPIDDSVDVGAAAERAETVALVRAAVGGLNDGERDVINQLWHGLDVPEVADVLGVSRNYAYTLFSRARDQLEASVAVLLVGRAGREDCAALDSLLGDWDGRLTARLRKRVGRHIDRCDVCSDRRRQELSPAMLYSLTPGAVLALAALRGMPMLSGARWLAGLPSGLRDTVLRSASAAGPHASAFDLAAGHGMHSFVANGFPKPAHYGHLGLVGRPHLPITMVSGTAVAATATVVVTAVVPHLRPAGTPPGDGRAGGAPSPGAASPALAGSTYKPAGWSTAPGSAMKHLRSVSVKPTATTSTAAPSGAVAALATAPIATASDTTASEASAPSLSVSVSGVATATVPLGTTSDSASSSTGTLSVSPSALVLSPLLGASLTLTASGGPVSWSIAEPTSLLGSITVSPSSGTLTAGSSVTVTIASTSLAAVDSQLTVEPGDHVVTVVAGIG